MRRLARLRDALGVPPEALAVRLGLQPVAVARLEASADPLWSSVERYSAALSDAADRRVAADVVITVDGTNVDESPPRPGEVPTGPGGDRAVRLRAWGDPDLERRFVRERFVAMGAAEIGDLTVWPGREGLATLLAEALPDRDGQAIKLFCTYWDRFVRYLRPGDLVVLPASKAKTVSIGEITGPYQYLPDERDARARHRRPVRWLATDLSRDVLDTDLVRAINAPGTIGAINAPDAAGRLRNTTGER